MRYLPLNRRDVRTTSLKINCVIIIGPHKVDNAQSSSKETRQLNQKHITRRQVY